MGVQTRPAGHPGTVAGGMLMTVVVAEPSSKSIVMVLFAVRIMVQEEVAIESQPVQDARCEPTCGKEFRTTVAPEDNDKLQEDPPVPQTIPTGDDVAVPSPLPCLTTEIVYREGALPPPPPPPGEPPLEELLLLLLDAWATLKEIV